VFALWAASAGNGATSPSMLNTPSVATSFRARRIAQAAAFSASAWRARSATGVHHCAGRIITRGVIQTILEHGIARASNADITPRLAM